MSQADDQPQAQLPAVLPEALISPAPGATQRTYSGMLTDDDSRRLRRKVFNLTQEEEMAIDWIVQSPVTSYRTFSEFVRHATYEMVMAWASAGFPDNERVTESLTTIVKARHHAQRLALRGQFLDIFSTIEVALLDWLEVGDWKAIDKELKYLDELVTETQGLSEKWAWRIESIIVGSSAVKKVVAALYQVWGRGMGTEEEKKAAEGWEHWMEVLNQG